MHPTVNIGGEEYAVRLVEVDNKSDKTEAVNGGQEAVSEKVSVVLGKLRLRACPLQPDRSSQTPRFRPSAVPVPTHR